MDDTFQIKVHAAAVAAWQAVVIAALFFVVQWLLFLGVMATQPAWVVPFWGPGATWESIHTVWFQALVYLRSRCGCSCLPRSGSRCGRGS